MHVGMSVFFQNLVGGMPCEMAARNLQPFADELLPQRKKPGSDRAATATDGARVAA
jgi:hypothetical protein